MAERAGFEPAVGQSPTPVFETGPFDRSGTSPPDCCPRTERPRANLSIFKGRFLQTGPFDRSGGLQPSVSRARRVAPGNPQAYRDAARHSRFVLPQGLLATSRRRGHRRPLQSSLVQRSLTDRTILRKRRESERCYLLRRKNSCKSVFASSARTPEVTSMRWFKRASSTML